MLSLCLALLVACLVEHRVFTDPTAINDDVRNQIYWMARITEPGLFPNDLIADYFSQPSRISPVQLALYQVAAIFISPVVFTQYLPFCMILLTVGGLFRYAETVAPVVSDALMAPKDEDRKKYAFWICTVFTAFVWVLKLYAGGLARSFFYPLLFFFLWQFAETSRSASEKSGLKSSGWVSVWLVLCVCLSALLYPPAMFLMLGFLGYQSWQGLRSRQTVRPVRLPLTLFVLSVLACIGLLAWRFLSDPMFDAFNPLTTNSAAVQMQEFYQKGRVVLFPYHASPTVHWFPSGILHLHWLEEILKRLPNLYIVIPGAVFALLFALYGKFLKNTLGAIRIPSDVWDVMKVSAGLYVLAWILLFYLYVPERFLQYTLPLLFVFFIGTLLFRLSAKISGKFQDSSRKILAQAALVLVTLLCFAPLMREDLVKLTPPEKAMFESLKNTPVDSLIAANTGISNNVPLFSGRSVLVSHEAYIPFHLGYFRPMKERLKDWLVAYYAKNTPEGRKTLAAFLEKYDIDYLVINLNDFEPYRLNRLAKDHYYSFSPEFFESLMSAGTPERSPETLVEKSTKASNRTLAEASHETPAKAGYQDFLMVTMAESDRAFRVEGSADLCIIRVD